MAWERFTQEGKDVNPKLTIRGNGVVGLNNSLITLFNLKGYKYVVLFIDKPSKRIGFKFSNDDNEKGKRKVRFHAAGGASIPARSFVTLNQLPKPAKFDCQFEEGMLIVRY